MELENFTSKLLESCFENGNHDKIYLNRACGIRAVRTTLYLCFHGVTRTIVLFKKKETRYDKMK
jgi:hypothetical protein